jgi:hypothetical protein
VRITIARTNKTLPLHLPLLDFDGCRRLEFHKRRQLFVRTHNEPLSVAMRVSNPDRSENGRPVTRTESVALRK